MKFKTNKFMEAFTELTDLLLIGLLLFLLCLPLITAGPAAAAFYYTAVKVLQKERGSLMASFFGSFRKNFRQGLVLGMICFGYLLIGLMDILLLYALGILQTGSPVQLFGVVYLLPLAFLLPWLFPYLSRFENTVVGTLKDCFYLATKHLKKSLLLMLLLFGFILLGVLLPITVPLLPAFFYWSVSRRLEPVFTQLAQTMESGKDPDPWYREGTDIK